MSTFFGQIFPSSPEYRLLVFQEIHEIVFYGKGGFDYDTVYHMPIWLRRYTLKKISEHYEEEAAAVQGKSSRVKTSGTEPPVIPKPKLRQADYTVSKKV